MHKKESSPEEIAGRLKAIIETATDGIITIDYKGIVDSINPSASTLFGYTREEVIGKNISMLMPMPERDEHDQYLNRYMQSGIRKIIGIGREVKGLKKDGSTFPFRLSVSELHDNERQLFTGIIHDLTEQKAAEEKLRKYATQLERSNKELEEFAYVSSHDLQEPLRKIRAFSDRIISMEKDRLSEKGLDYLERVGNAAERMQGLISDLLEYSRVTTRAKPFVKTDLEAILEEVVSDLEVAIEKSKAVIKIGELPALTCDPRQMYQMFQNLLSNAIKFRHPDRQLEIIVSGEIREDEEGNKLAAIQVHDNGIGFEQEYATKIFQVFQRLEGRKYEGSGIGLSICKKIADRHGGNIQAFGEKDEGTRFLILLPISQNTGLVS